MSRTIRPPEFPSAKMTNKDFVIDQLTQIIDVHEHNAQIYQDEIEILKAQIAGLQKAPKKPKIKPSTIEKPSRSTHSRSHKSKGSKKDRLPVHEEIERKAENVLPGSLFKGYRTYLVQDIVIKPHNILFKLERWQQPDGSYVQASLPTEYRGFHFGPCLRTFILQQYYQARVTQPKLLEELSDWNIEISKGELNHLLSANTPQLKEEAENLLKTALDVSTYIQTDDTGARHKGQNHICTQIGNHLFTFFETGKSKSRLHFLDLLNHQSKYLFNEAAIDYLKRHGSLKLIKYVSAHQGQILPHFQLTALLKDMSPKPKRLLQEAAHLGYLNSILGPDFVILSDGARQFKVLNHASCWVHALRLLEKAKSLHNEEADALLEKIRFFYHHLKRYRSKPSALFRKRLKKHFDRLALRKTYSPIFDKALFRFFLDKRDLLRALEVPDVPLHNNLSENDIREYVVRRKISGGTRSDLGKDSRDVFLSLTKTCKKLQISFWEFLQDRVFSQGKIPSLSELFQAQHT